jgi:xylulokinase
MKAAEYLAGIDAGTTGTTVMLVDLEGNQAGSAYREYPCVYPHPGWVEQNIELVWRKVCEASQEVIATTGVDPRQIRSIGISSQRGTFVCVDAAVNPLHNSIVWNDTRATSHAEQLGKKIGSERYQFITGMPISALWAAPKIMWLIQEHPEIIENCYKIINGQEFLLNRLGAETLYADPSSLTLNGMMAIDRFEWSQEIISTIGLSADQFPRMATPAHQEGVVSSDAGFATGFAPGTPICRGGGDQQCAAIGAGIIHEGMAEITVGTAAMMVAHIDRRRKDPDQVAYTGGHAFPHKWDLEGGAFATGACLRWWRDVFGQLEKQTSGQPNLDVFDLLTQEAAKAPAGCKGHIFFPFMNGQATPTYDNTARGGSLGLTLAHDRPTMIRSVLEGTGYELRMVVEALEKVLGSPFDILRVTGGGSKSTLWMQIQADIYGRPVETLQNPECTTFGAAILGGVGTGVFTSIEEAVQSLVKTNLIIEPNTRRHELYSELFGIFKDTFYALREKKVYERLSQIQDRI